MYAPSFLVYHLGFYYDTSLIKDIENLVLERNLRDNAGQPPRFADVKSGDAKPAAQGLPGLPHKGPQQTPAPQSPRPLSFHHILLPLGAQTVPKSVIYLHEYRPSTAVLG